ncbi:MAG: DnaA N-terminal domain-containing protein [Anaerolineaceae bacterium]
MTETRVQYAPELVNTIDAVEVSARKVALLSLLDRGIVIKKEWDDLLRDLRIAGLTESLAQLLRYYKHYRIDQMGMPLPEPLFKQEENPEPEPELTIVRAQTYSAGPQDSEYIPWRESLKIWNQAITELRKSGKIPNADFDTWIRSLRPAKMETGHVTIKAINKYCKVWVEENAIAPLRESFVPFLGEDVTIEIVVEDK